MSMTRENNFFYYYDAKKQELNLDYKGLTDQDVLFTVLPFLKKYPVTTLNLKHNNIGASGAQMLATASIKTLLLGDNSVGDEGAIAFLVNQTLETLDLSSNNIGHRGAKSLASHRYIKGLDLHRNNLGNLGAKAFLHSKFKTLNLQKNKIGDEGAFFLAANRSIEILDLGMNEIGDAGAISLAANQYLKVLNLTANMIGNHGALAFAKQKYLENLNIGWNCIEDLGALALANNLYFKKLNLKENNLSKECIDMLVKVTPNPTIRSNFRLQFAKSFKLPNLIDLCLFKLKQHQNLPLEGAIKDLICENANLVAVQNELNNFELQLKNMTASFNHELKAIIINADDEEAQLKQKLNLYVNKKLLIDKINENLKHINRRLLELDGSQVLVHEKWASVFLEDHQSKFKKHKEKIKIIISSVDALKNKMQIINDNLESIQYVRANDFLRVNGELLRNIKKWILKNQHYINLINRYKKMPDTHPKRKDLLLFLNYVANSQDLDQIAKLISPIYCSAQDVPNDLFIKQINDDMRRTTFFSSTTAQCLKELEKDFLRYLSENFHYRVQRTVKIENLSDRTTSLTFGQGLS
jgi:hypothetical protein